MRLHNGGVSKCPTHSRHQLHVAQKRFSTVGSLPRRTALPQKARRGLCANSSAPNKLHQDFKVLYFKDPCHLLNNALEDVIRTSSFRVLHNFVVHFPALLKSSPELRYILQHYRLGRLHYPPAHKDLPRRDAVLWRKLQTGVFPNPWLYSKVYPHLVTPHCRYGSQSVTLIHMAWTCPQYADASHTEDTWESLLRTTDSAQQRRVISRALEAAASQGIPAELL
ncbi:hypothetical protein HPB50_001496 [Hyalomma asiaticum]|uniref:Uncharacterized protein n=1 Tax=Hyalomma asiaticum TaxID=266040 RepID=A0ACB7T7L4_HYAAI|nr:hypothetical protein HPB50_001496 [Hyalomma asiaticum]